MPKKCIRMGITVMKISFWGGKPSLFLAANGVLWLRSSDGNFEYNYPLIDVNVMRRLYFMALNQLGDNLSSTK